MTRAHLKAIEELIADKGEKRNSYFYGKLTSKQVIEKMGKANTPEEQRYVAYTARAHYPGTLIERGSGDEGWVLNIKIRVK